MYLEKDDNQDVEAGGGKLRAWVQWTVSSAETRDSPRAVGEGGAG